MATPDARISFADLDALDAERLGRRLNEKWNTYPDKDVLCAWVAEMDFPLARPIRAVLERALESDDVGYAIALRDTGLADAFAARMDERFGWRVEPERCEILSEVVQGLYLSLLAYSEPGDGAVVQTPIYPPFLSAVRETGRALVENRLVRTGGPGDARFEIDFDALARDAGVTLRRAGRARRASVIGNSDKLAQVFINLISNAIKYNTSASPVVTVSSRVRKGVYEARVVDNGPGVSGEDRDRIFARFTRGPLPRKQGAGLGLAISRQIVEAFGGSLMLATDRRKGAEFIVQLDCAETEPLSA